MEEMFKNPPDGGSFDKTLLNAIPLGVDVVDRDLNILYMNDAMKRIAGGDMVGKKCYMVYKDRQKQCSNCPLGHAAAADGGAIETDGALGGKSLKITHNFIRFQGKEAILEVFEDITESKIASDKLQKSFERLQLAFSETVNALSAVVESRDPYTAGHQRSVAELAMAIARELGLGGKQINAVYTAGVLHDLGKITVPAEILSKPGKLSEAEFALIKQHPAAGYEILRHIEFDWPIADIVLQHHEKMDGSGYPNGLKGEDIRLEARIIAVADVVEAIHSHRPYRPSLGIETALEEISSRQGIAYDPQVARACVKLFGEGRFEF